MKMYKRHYNRIEIYLLDYFNVKDKYGFQIDIDFIKINEASFLGFSIYVNRKTNGISISFLFMKIQIFERN
jgi:hypothetical protein